MIVQEQLLSGEPRQRHSAGLQEVDASSQEVVMKLIVFHLVFCTDLTEEV